MLEQNMTGIESNLNETLTLPTAAIADIIDEQHRRKGDWLQQSRFVRSLAGFSLFIAAGAISPDIASAVTVNTVKGTRTCGTDANTAYLTSRVFMTGNTGSANIKNGDMTLTNADAPGRSITNVFSTDATGNFSPSPEVIGDDTQLILPRNTASNYIRIHWFTTGSAGNSLNNGDFTLDNCDGPVSPPTTKATTPATRPVTTTLRPVVATTRPTTPRTTAAVTTTTVPAQTTIPSSPNVTPDSTTSTDIVPPQTGSTVRPGVAIEKHLAATGNKTPTRLKLALGGLIVAIGCGAGGIHILKRRRQAQGL